MIKIYNSISDAVAESLRFGDGEIYYPKSDSNDLKWFGYETPENTLRLSKTGNVQLVPEAEKVISQLETQLNTPRKVWRRNVAGAYASVPDYLAGLPTNMCVLRHEPTEHSPINIYVRPNASAGVTAQQLQKRGTVILALVMALSRSRPVSLWYYFCGDSKHMQSPRDYANHTVIAIRIETAPLNLAQACYLLTSAGFYRRLCMGLGHKLNKFIGGPVVSLNVSQTICFDLMGNDPERTLVIGPSTRDDPLLENPIQWLNEQLKKFNPQTGE
jgi:hypothetical protein